MARQFHPTSIHGIYDPVTDVTIHCILYIPIWLPTKHELDHCQIVELTSDDEWKPYNERFLERE